MKREDMGRDVLPPTRPTRNPRIEKIFVPLPQNPESGFSQAGKAPEGAPGTDPHLPMCSPAFAISSSGADSRRPRRAHDHRASSKALGLILGDSPRGPTAEGDSIDWRTPDDVAGFAQVPTWMARRGRGPPRLTRRQKASLQGAGD